MENRQKIVRGLSWHGSQHQASKASDNDDPQSMETLSKQLFPAGGENLVKWSGPVCFPNTRVEILDEIRVKMDDAEGKFIVWLNGMAGSGKSTIARTVAQGYAKQNRLAAMFSFSRDEADRSHAAKFIPSIALQLAGLSSAFHAHICEVLAENPNIPRSDIKEQWSKLFLEPLSTLEADFPQLPLYLVVDALDACDDLSHIYGILQLFAEAKPLETKLRILVTSRPETTVRVAFRNMPGTLYQNVALNKIPQATVESDISTFFGHKIEEIRSISESLSPDWPGEEKLSLLVSRALGSFIYAETVCRFIRERAKDGLQDDALQSILSTTVKQDDLARNTTAIRKATTSEVDLLYNEILEDIFKAIGPTEDDQQPASIFKKVAGTTITLFEPLSTIAMAGLLDIAEGNVNEQLQHLQSFLEVPESEEAPVCLLHSSFRDFLLDNKRCSNQQVWIDQKGAHETIARDCMRLMSSQLQHISNLHLRGMQANEAALEIIGGDFPPELQYACRYWIKHLRQSDICLVENDQIHVFLQQFSFYWIEALGLMSRASESILAISLLESIVAMNQARHLDAIIENAKSFALKSQAIFEVPFQICYPAPVFSPEIDAVQGQPPPQTPRWVRKLPDTQTDWGSLLRSLNGHPIYVRAVVFSPDGQLVASASSGKTVCLWKSVTGELLHTLEGHADWVNVLTFSPNGRLLASASDDKAVRLWDTATGELCGVLEGHSNWVRAIAFSPDSRFLASGSDDTTIQLWETAGGTPCGILKGHSNWVCAVAFSPDGQLIGSGSRDKTVKIWEAATGVHIMTLTGHSGGVNAVAFSDDSLLVASASDDKTVKLWKNMAGAPWCTLDDHLGPVRAVLFSADGQLVASVSDDKTVRLWETATGAQRSGLKHHYSSPTDVPPPSRECMALDWSMDIRSLFPGTFPPLPKSLQNLHLEEHWVAQVLESILGLPSEYRTTCAAVCNNVLVLGHASGRVSFFEFDAGTNPV